MPLQTMYAGMVNSPETTLTNSISPADTTIYVLDPSRVPEPLPNLMTLGTGTNAETVLVTALTDSAMTVTRGYQGIPKDWPSGTIIARNFTEYDHAAFKSNIETLQGDITDLQGEVDTKATKAVPAAAGNLAGLAADGDLQDSGIASTLVGRVYTSLASMGLSDADMSPTDFGANVQTLLNALPARSDLKLYLVNDPGSTYYALNLTASIQAYANMTINSYELRLSKSLNLSIPNIGFIVPDAGGTLQPLIYFTYDNALSAPAILNAGSNDNILINPEFSINGRGAASYGGGASGYTVDRWWGILSVGGDFTVATKTLKKGGQYAVLRQAIEFPEAYAGKTLTFSLRLDAISSDMSISMVKATGMNAGQSVLVIKYISQTDSPGIYSCTTTIPNDVGASKAYPILFVSISVSTDGGSIGLGKAKLELGTISTLAYDPPQGYDTELAKCQRYYQIRSVNSIDAKDLRPTMRIAPTVTAVTGGYAYDAEIY